jgi:predicted XRE-type DNA-binding protein
MTGSKTLKIMSSTGSLFRDLGFRREEAVHLLVRADLMIQVQKLIASRRLKQRNAAKILGVTQPRVTRSGAKGTSGEIDCGAIGE